jgi:hypothetical protein
MSFSGKFTPLQLNVISGYNQGTGIEIKADARAYQGTWSSTSSYTQGTVTGSNTQYPAFRVNNNIIDAGKGSLLFKIAPSAVQNIVDNNFVVYKTTSVTGISGASQIIVSLAAAAGNDGAETVATADPGAFYVAQNGVATLSGPITVNSVTVGVLV